MKEVFKVLKMKDVMSVFKLILFLAVVQVVAGVYVKVVEIMHNYAKM